MLQLPAEGSRRLANKAGESNLGRHNHSMAPFPATKAAPLLFDKRA
jgi:hypothetical protein